MGDDKRIVDLNDYRRSKRRGDENGAFGETREMGKNGAMDQLQEASMSGEVQAGAKTATSGEVQFSAKLGSDDQLQDESKNKAGHSGYISSRHSGEVVACMMAAWLGMAALTASHWWSAADPAHANLFLLWLSSWLPGGLRIGPYGGKELVGLTVWLGSWLILFLLLKRVEVRLYPWIYGFAIGVIILLVLLWPPLYHRFYGWPI